MSLAPLPAPRPQRDRLLSAQTGQPRRRGPDAARLIRRRWLVRIAKYLLPVIALALLGSIAIWPEVIRLHDQERVTFRRLTATDNDTGQVTEPRYRGVDERDQPYTLTAATARQAGQDRVNLVDPKGDVTTSNGSWMMVQSQQGVFLQHEALLDLSGEVVLYRDDGTTLHTDSATVDLHAGAAAGDAQVHAEGPFGSLDAQAFALTDKGDVVQFTGPAKLVLNGGTP